MTAGGDPLAEAARAVASSHRILVLTGAGISAESGIPPFRGKGGIWSRYDPMEYGTHEALVADPGKVWKMLYELGRDIDEARPNPAHRALAELEASGRVRMLIATQNVDGLHQRAGSRNVVELHGGSRELYCMRCGARQGVESVEVDPARLPPRCACGGALRPDVVLFGENLPPEAWGRAQRFAEQSDLALVVGTSAEVAPAAWLPEIAKQAGARLVEVNPERTWLTSSITDLFVPGLAGEILPVILAP